MDRPRSNRHPWVRSSLMGLVPFLLPFVWLLELDSCGHPVPQVTEVTGSEVIGKFDLEAWALIVPVLLAVVLTPFIAARVPTIGWRVIVHVLGFIAAGMMGYGAFFAMFFTIFSTREAKGVGWIVIALFVGSLLDALLRLIWSIGEWRAARRSAGEASPR